MMALLRARSRSRAGRHRVGSDRGVAAVEFAIIVPLLLLLILGILEFAFLMRDYLGVSSSVRVGTRIAATGAGAGPAVCPVPLPEGVTSCAGTDTPQLAVSAANAIQRAGTAMPQDLVDEIWIYRSNASGFPANAYFSSDPTATAGGTTNAVFNNPANCTTACVRYRWNPTKNVFEWRGGSWDSSRINGCIQNADSVGVYMKATHPFITGFFVPSLTIQDRSVMTFEPLPSGKCAPGAHI
jgi:hypothetical protein